MCSMPSSVRHRCDLLVRCLIVVKAVSIFIPKPRIMPRIFSFPTEVKSFDKYVEGWDNFVSVTTNRLDELRYNYRLVI
jgi:flagellar motor switch protein FliM